MLRAVSRSLAAVLLVFLTSFSVVLSSGPAGAAGWWPPPTDGFKVTPTTAAKVGTKVATPVRLLTTATPWGLAANAAGAGFLYWSIDTESGRNFWKGVAEELNLTGGRGTGPCQASINVEAWGQTSVVVTSSVAGNRQNWPSVGANGACSDYFSANPSLHMLEIKFVCQSSADSSFYLSGGGWTNHVTPMVSNGLCGGSSSDWLVGMHVSETSDTIVSFPGPAYLANPVWPGSPDLPSPYESLTTVEISVKCTNGSGGSITTLNYSFKIAQSSPLPTPPKCSGTQGEESYTVDIVRAGVERLRVAAWARDRVASQAAGCYLTTTSCGVAVVDSEGQMCAYGRPGCDTWYSTELETPGSFTCRWGATTVPIDDCRILRWGYVTPDGAIQPPDQPNVLPVPYYPPGGSPAPTNPPYTPGDGSNPDWLNPAQCPPSGSPIEAGLQPIAVQGARCLLFHYPGFTLTSGWRPTGSTPNSDHPFGLAIDVAPSPSWDTAAGNLAGWGAAGWLTQNAGLFGIKYIIWNGKIWYPQSGWTTYTHPDGTGSPSLRHDDHIHISYKGEGAQPRNDMPTQPGTGTVTPPQTGGGFPTTGTSPSDPDNCLSAAWSWNPADWVLVPSKCALQWAFVPSVATRTQVETTMSEAVADTGIPTWVDTAEGIPPAMAAPSTPTAGCMGPPMDLPDPFPTIYLFEACDGFRATMAGYTKTFMTVGLVVGTLLTTTTLISRGFGYDASTGGKA